MLFFGGIARPLRKRTMAVVQPGEVTVQRTHRDIREVVAAHIPSPSMGHVVSRGDACDFNYLSHW